MKVSLRWIFDHIDADYADQSVEEIFTKFNGITAEIESSEEVTIDVKKLYAGKILMCDGESSCEIKLPELKKTVKLPPRTNHAETNDGYFLVHRDGDTFRWAVCKDVGLDKDGLLPAFDMSEEGASGSFRDVFESEDIIFDVDNKSLTHRPDMWGHRGFAREIAAFLKLPLTNKKQFLADIEGREASKFSIEIKAPEACSRFAGLHIDSIENKPSNLLIASRLVKVGVRPINGIVDLTNYVMLDWSQPVHAYDAKKIADKKFIARMAKGGETLTILDGQELELTKDDLVIADGKKPVGLAGIMGGRDDSIDLKTDSIFFEAANFDATHVRRTSLRHGVRTDSSARFEKTLDPNQITDSILRFVALCRQAGIHTEIVSEMLCVGKEDEEKTIGVTHSFLERRSGIKLTRDEVLDPLRRLEFEVEETQELIGDKEDVLYTIKIPSFRGTKDIEIKEDILEEIIRFFGFNKIALTLPELARESRDLTPLFRMRKIKNFLAYTAGMIEQRNYLYSDEDFLREIGVNFDGSVGIKNPVSENNARLATSLLINLFKNVSQNIANENRLKFFECGRVCRMVKDDIVEEKKIAGIFFEKRENVDFFECKQYLTDLCKVCGLQDSEVSWKKIDEKGAAFFHWVMPYQSADILLNGKKIGSAGKVNNAFLVKLGALPESEAFFFEIDSDALVHHVAETIVYTPLSKFQEVTFDLSFMIPITRTVEELHKNLLDSDDLVARVALIDFFDKKEWVDKRSLAFRLWVSHPEKTLNKEEIDGVRESAIHVLEKLGAELRS